MRNETFLIIVGEVSGAGIQVIEGIVRRAPCSIHLYSEIRESCRGQCKSCGRKTRSVSVTPSEGHPLRPAFT